MNDLLPFLLIIPLIGAVVGALVPERSAKGWALFTSTVTFVVALVLAYQFYTQIIPAPDPPSVPERVEASFPIGFGPANAQSSLHSQTLGISFSLAMDSIS